MLAEIRLQAPTPIIIQFRLLFVHIHIEYQLMNILQLYDDS